MTSRAEIIGRYLKRFPGFSKSAISRKLALDYPDLFKNNEHARDTIRRYTGANGKNNRGTNYTKLTYTPPPSEEREWKPYIMPTTADKLLILSDIHLPYHNEKALLTAINYGIDNGANTLFLNGDLMDCYQVSRYEKDRRKRNMVYEIEMTKQFLKDMSKIFSKVFWKLGNHEERWKHYLSHNAPELLDFNEFRLDVLTDCKLNGIEMIEDKRIVKAGKLNIMHGHEFGNISSAVNPARSYYLKTKESVICGHLHQSSEHTEPNLSGSITTSFSSGCLCELHPEYAPINRWNHGFAFVEIKKDGTFKVKNKRIINGEIV